MEEQKKVLTIEVNLATKEFEKKIEDVVKKLKEKEKQIEAFDKVLESINAAFLSFGKEAIKYATDLQQAFNKVDGVFGKSSDAVKSFTQQSLSSFGMAQSSALSMVADFGGMGRIMSLNEEQAAAMSTQLVALSGDLASFRHVEVEAAGSALKDAIKGDTDALADLGIAMTDTKLQSFAVANGIKETYKHMTEAEKAALRYGFVMDQTKNIQGDFAKTGGGAANQMFIFTESVKQLYSSFGEILLPVFSKAVGIINQFIQGFAGLDPVAKKTILVLGGLAVALPMLKSAFEKVSTVIKGFKLTFGAMAGPVAIVAIAIVAFTALVIKNWDAIKQKLVDNKMWSTLTNLVDTSLGMIVEIFDLFGNILSGNWKGVWENLLNIAKGLWNTIVNVVAGAIKGLIFMTAGLFESFGLDSVAKKMISFNQNIDNFTKKISADTTKLTENADKVKTALSKAFNWQGLIDNNKDPLDLEKRQAMLKEFLDRLKQIRDENVGQTFKGQLQLIREAYEQEGKHFEDYLKGTIITCEQYEEYLKQSAEKFANDIDKIYDRIKLKPIPIAINTEVYDVKDKMQARLDAIMAQASVKFPPAAFTQAQKDALAVGTLLAEGIKNAIGAGLDGLAQLFEGIFTKAFGGKYDFRKLFSGVLSTIGDLMIATGKATVLQGIAIEALKKLEGVGAVVAGVALIAGGAALKGAANSFNTRTETNASLSTPSLNNSAPSYGAKMGSKNEVVFKIEGTQLVGVLNNTNQAWGI